MSKFKLTKNGDFVEVKIKKSHKPVLKETVDLPAKGNVWSKIARFFYSCFMRLKNQMETSIEVYDPAKLYEFNKKDREEQIYKDFFGM